LFNNDVTDDLTICECQQ